MLDLAIVGAGAMGANHGRVAMGLRDARVAVVVDPDPVAGEKLATATGAAYQPELSAVIGKIDAAVLASPTDLHRELGIALLDAGVAVLVEKPISAKIGDADALIAAAKASSTVLMVGHTERFNPAVLELDSLVTDPIHVVADRISPYTPRIKDGVFLDLMIHDIDIVLHLIGSPLAGLASYAMATHSDTEDLAVAMLRFEKSSSAVLTSSRIGQQKIRRLAITQPETFVAVDLIRQDVTVHRVEDVAFTSGESVAYRQAGVVEIPYLQHQGEPLYLELQHFVECVQSGNSPRVSGWDGREALRVALDIADQARRPG